MNNISDTVRRLALGLETIDQVHVCDLVTRFGLYGAARILGYDVSHYNKLLMAGRLVIEHLRDNAPKTILEYSEVMKGRLNSDTYSFIQQHHEELQRVIDKNKELDYDHDWFSANTMITQYSAAPQYGEASIETPQYTWMRIAIQMYFDSEHSLERVIGAYEEMAHGWYTPASPTIFNAGMKASQMSSCFLLSIGDDLEKILKTGIYRAGMISKSSGGLGFDVSRVRHSEIGNYGYSKGIVPMIQLYNYMVRYVDQCFVPETTVYTETGPKLICDVVAGDRIITNDGTFDDVKFTMPHDYEGDVVDVKVHNTFKEITVTPTHPILVIRGQALCLNFKTLANRLEKGYVTPEWADAHTLKPTDFVAFPIPTYTRDLPEYSAEDMYMYGLMIGDGSIEQRDGSCRICLGTERKGHLIEFVTKYLAMRNIRFTEHSGPGCLHITWSGKSNFRFNRNMLYDAECTKILHHYFIHLPKDKALSLVAGLLSADGTIAKEWVLDTTSQQVAEAIRYIMLRMGAGTSGYIRDRIGESHETETGTITNKKLCYSLRIPKIPELAAYLNVPAGKFTKYLAHNGVVWSRVEHVSKPYKHKGVVYDLEMCNNHNYLTHMGLAHNGGRRKGAVTIFLRPHHLDVEDFIDLTRKVGDKYSRAHDINTCLWTSWVFWDRIRTNGQWTLFCPARTPQLNDLYGEAFTKAYIEAENDPTILPHHKKVVNARDLYNKILSVQRESGMPYLMNGDAANLKSNHRHNGYIKSSNLCLEIIEYTDDDTIAVCNLHSLSLRTFAKCAVDFNNKNVHEALCDAVDFNQLAFISRRVIENLNAVIDHNWYPLDKHDEQGKLLKAKIINKSNKNHRPVGMGTAGLAEMLHILDLPFEHPITVELNKMIFACMYWNALAQSIQLAIYHGVYETFKGSPASEGKLQFDLWREEFQILGPNAARKAEDDDAIEPAVWHQQPIRLLTKTKEVVDTIKPTWTDLKRCVVKYGLYNSLLLANMPTASTAQVRRNCESVEPHQNNLYSRKVLNCSYPVLNRYMVADLEKLGLWNDNTVEYVRVKNGSIQGFSKYVTDNKSLFAGFKNDTSRLIHVEKKYKTMWEISQKWLMKLTADRSRYIDQSSSTNVFMKDCTDEKLQACHIYANMLGLKTIMYYLRTKGGETIKFTADPNMIQHIRGIKVEREDSESNDNTEKVVNNNFPLSLEQEPDVKINKGTGLVCTDDVCVSCT